MWVFEGLPKIYRKHALWHKNSRYQNKGSLGELREHIKENWRTIDNICTFTGKKKHEIFVIVYFLSLQQLMSQRTILRAYQTLSRYLETY